MLYATTSAVLLVFASYAALQKPMPITIDVKPGDDPTTLERSRDGFVPVAILSTAKFDALAIDVSTVRVGRTGTEAEPARSMQSDVDNDKRLDLMLLVRVNDLGLACDTKLIRLTAKTTDGTSVEGSDPVTIIGCADARRQF
jgi:hypothetical protein